MTASFTRSAHPVVSDLSDAGAFALCLVDERQAAGISAAAPTSSNSPGSDVQAFDGVILTCVAVEAGNEDSPAVADLHICRTRPNFDEPGLIRHSDLHHSLLFRMQDALEESQVGSARGRRQALTYFIGEYALGVI